MGMYDHSSQVVFERIKVDTTRPTRDHLTLAVLKRDNTMFQFCVPRARHKLAQ
jgi:hypothetical protein